jgi:hypothetical protein
MYTAKIKVRRAISNFSSSRDLMPDALQRLRAAKNFEMGQNHVFRPGYPFRSGRCGDLQ